MSTKAKLLAVSAAMLIVGGLMIAFLNTKGAEPTFTCVTDGGATSGFTDSSRNDCPVSIDSYNTWREWSGTPQYGRIAGLGIAVVGLVIGVVGLVKRSSK